jgi:acyl-coenzyme A synthetase/AMP-(fatty) acid ligase
VRLAAAVTARGEDGDELVVAVELRGAGSDVQERVRAAVAASVGVQVARVVTFAALPRTTSGKLRRKAVKVSVAVHG